MTAISNTAKMIALYLILVILQIKCGEADRECGTDARLAFNANGTLVAFNQGLYDRQTKTAAAGGAGTSLVYSIESLKYMFERFLGDALSGIADGYDRVVVITIEINQKFSAVFVVFYAIFNKRILKIPISKTIHLRRI